MNIDDIIRKIWDTQGFGNVAVWPDGTMTVVSGDYTDEPDGRRPLAVLKPIPLVARYPMLDHALGDPELRKTIEDAIGNTPRT